MIGDKDMSLEKTSFKLDCTIPASVLIRESIMFIVFVVITAGLALPLCIFRLGKVMINHTDMIQK
jgi:hypothetical protein